MGMYDTFGIDLGDNIYTQLHSLDFSGKTPQEISQYVWEQIGITIVNYITTHLKTQVTISPADAVGILSTSVGNPVGIIAPIIFSVNGNSLWA